MTLRTLQITAAIVLSVFCWVGLSRAASAIEFLPKVDYATGADPASIAVGDFSGDGVPDLAVVNASSNSVLVYLGNADGTFQAAVTYAVGSLPEFATTGNLNADGYRDLIVTNSGSNSVSVLLGNGDGTFQNAVDYPVGNGPYGSVIGDFNGDGNLDVAVADNAGNTVSLLLGNGSGTFSAPVSAAAGTGPYSLAAGDFNGDGSFDLAVSSLENSHVSILLGNSDGTFQAAVNYTVASKSWSLVTGDFNGDGAFDLAVAAVGSDNVSILLGNGDGTFGAAENYGAGSSPTSVSVGDFNSDGISDLYVTNFGSNNISILPGNGDGTFQPPLNFSAGEKPVSGALGDFNGDGKSDLVVVNFGNATISVLLDNRVTVRITPAPYNFGNVATNSSASRIFTIRNSGGSDLVVSGITAINSLLFTVATSGQADSCASLAPTIVAGGACTIAVIFSPDSDGLNHTATLRITSNDPSAPNKDVVLTGSSGLSSDYIVTATGSGANGTIVCASPVPVGNPAVCTITPASGYSLVALTDNGSDKLAAVSGNSYTISAISADHTVVATFAIVYTVTATVTGGNGTVTCNSPVISGNSSNCSVTPTAGYQLDTFIDNSVDNKSFVSGTSYIIANVTANHIITATFVEIPVNGACGSSNGGIFTAVPVANFCTSGIPTAVTGTGPWAWSCSGIFNGIDANCSAAVQTYTVTASATGGSVTCDSPVNYGATSNCSVIPTPGFQLDTFVDNNVDKKSSVSGIGYLLANVTANHVISATFIPIPVNGVCGPSNSGTFTAAPTANFCTSGTPTAVTGTGPWAWNCSGSNGGIDASCSAAIQTYTVAATVTGGSVTCDSPVNHGDTSNCSVIPTPGFQLDTFVDNNVDKKGSVSGVSYSIAPVTANHTITATFVPIPVNGVCGSSNGGTFTAAPAANFCTSGIPTVVTGTGPWVWSCSGIFNGVDANCSAAVQTYTVAASATGGSVTCDSPVNYGATSNCSVIPVAGYQLDTFVDNNVDKKGSVSGIGYAITTVTANHVIAATFIPIPVNGVCGPSNGGTFTTAPTANFCTSGTPTGVTGSGPWVWSCSGSNGGAGSSCSASIQTYTVTATVSSGSGTVTCDSPVVAGATSNCSVIPTAGYQLDTFVDNNVDTKSSVSGVSYSIAPVTVNHSVTATFIPIPVSGVCGSSNGGVFTTAPTANLCTSGTPTTVTGAGPWDWNCNGSNGGATAVCSASIQTYTVTATVTGGNGTITCDSPVMAGAASTCSITPATGYQLVTLTDNGINKLSDAGGNNYTITAISADHAITAGFALNSLSYTISTTVPSAHGTVVCTSPVGVGGSSVCTITPDSGYQLATFTDNGVNKFSAVSGNSYVINAISADHVITANFYLSSLNYTITTTVPGDNGAVVCTSPVGIGGSSVCTITGGPGYQLATLTDNGVDRLSAVSGNNYIINTVSADHDIIVTFTVTTVRDGIINPAAGKVAPDISDALAALRYTVGVGPLVAYQLQHADVAPLGADGKPLGNGVVDIADVIIILRRVLGIGDW